MKIIKGGIYIQHKGITDTYDDINLVIHTGAYRSDPILVNIEFILCQSKDLLITYGNHGAGVFLHRLSIPTFNNILKCGTIINPKYKNLLKEFLEGLV